MADIRVYESSVDDFIPVTQEWCDNAQFYINKFVKQRNILKSILNLNITKDQEKLDKIGDFLNTIQMEW